MARDRLPHVRWLLRLTVVLVVEHLGFSLVTAFLLLVQVPSHWHARGQVDSSLPPWGLVLMWELV